MILSLVEEFLIRNGARSGASGYGKILRSYWIQLPGTTRDFHAPWLIYMKGARIVLCGEVYFSERLRNGSTQC